MTAADILVLADRAKGQGLGATSGRVAAGVTGRPSRAGRRLRRPSRGVPHSLPCL